MKKKLINELKELRKKEDDKLKLHVINYFLDDVNNDEDLKLYVEDLLSYGCRSGMVGHLIYYNDSEKFYEKYKNEINNLLHELLESTGISIIELFGDKWDKEDPLALNKHNINLLAWCGFEEMTREVYVVDLKQEF